MHTGKRAVEIIEKAITSAKKGKKSNSKSDFI